MNRHLVILTAFVAIGVKSQAELDHADPAPTQLMCRSENYTSQVAANSVRSFLSSAHPALVASAQGMNLAGMPTAPVTLVTDEAICARGAAEMDSLGIASASNAVYVFQIATSHWVVDPATLPAGVEFGRGFVFDSLWAYKGTITLWGTGG